MMRIRSFVMGALIALLTSMSVSAAERVISLVLICDIYKISEENGRGGLPRVTSVLKAEKARSQDVFVAHAGDAISPSLISGFDQGAHMIELLNQLPIDAFVPGNHEYDFGAEIFRKRMSEARFPLYAANLREADGRLVPGFIDGKIIPYGDVKIGVIGLTAEDSAAKSKPSPLRITSMLETAKTLGAKMRQDGADVIVLVSHSNREIDDALVDSGVAEVILSGDDHDFYLRHSGKSVIVEAAMDGSVVVIVDLKVNVDESAGKRKVSWWPDFRIIDTATVTPDPDMTLRVNAIEEKLSAQLNVAIGRTTVDLDTLNGTVRGGEAAMANLFTDAMRAASGADAALINGGSLRANRVLPAGSDITRRDILAEMPFNDLALVIEMTGAELKAALEEGVTGIEKPIGRFPQVSGMSLTADLKRPVGNRITSLKIGGKPIESMKKYRIAIPGYLSTGGDGYTLLQKARVVVPPKDAKLVTNGVIDYIEAKQTVSPQVEGRVVIKR